MSGEHAQHGPEHLDHDVVACLRCVDLLLQQEHPGYRGVEVRARDGAEHGDEHDEDGPGRDGVAEQGDRHVSAGQPLPHDARADHRGQEKSCAQELGAEPLSLGGALHGCHTFCEDGLDLARPISSSRLCKESLSSELSGRLTKMPMR